jgi:Mg-chelatase subunit ChlD
MARDRSSSGGKKTTRKPASKPPSRAKTTKGPAKTKTTRPAAKPETIKGPSKAKTTRAPAKAKTTRAPAPEETTLEPAAPETAKAPPATQERPVPVKLRGGTRMRFTLYNLLGTERAYYQVERREVERSKAPAAEQAVAHSVIIIDRSGSMEPYIEDTKETLVKILTLDEYSQYDLLVTLISYSSEGDCQVHFQRTPIQDIMRRESKYLREVDKIEATGATCISQALQLAAEVAREGEMTAVTLHSDGYANDPSPIGEVTKIDKLCQEMQRQPVFVNTIAYTEYSDFRLLTKVANSVSGSCLRAGNIRQVYENLYKTEKLLGEASLAGPIELPLEKGCDYQVFVSHKGRKINGAAGLLKILGLTEEDDAAVYHFKKLTEADYNRLEDVEEVQTDEALFAFARTQLSEGNLNTAKYALASTYDATLVERHGKALTNLQVAALAQDLDTVLFDKDVLEEHEVLDHVPVNPRPAVLAVIHLLDEHRGDFLVNLKYLKENYVRRGVRRVPGTRDEDGTLIEPALKTEYTDRGDYAPVTLFDVNRNTANLNMLIARPVRLVARDGGGQITEVAGVPLDKLTVFKNYTVVCDGELNLPLLKIRITGKKLFDELKNAGVLENEDGSPAVTFDVNTDYMLRMDQLPLVPPFEGAIPLDGIFDDLAEVRVMRSIIAAHIKEESDVYTQEQLEGLKKHYLSKNLYVNFPTTTEYTDLQEALAAGTVDSRVSYKVDIGSRKVLNMGKLMSANKFLDRLYEVLDADGDKISKPTFESFLDGDVTVRHKHLSSRMKITAVDRFMQGVFDDFLGLANNGIVHGILSRVGAADLQRVLQRKRRDEEVSRKEYVAALTDAGRKLDAYADAVFRERVSPLVFFVGTTGMLPDEMETRALTAEQLTARYPDLVVSKDEQEGMFYEIGDTIVSVYAETEYFSR